MLCCILFFPSFVLLFLPVYISIFQLAYAVISIPSLLFLVWTIFIPSPVPIMLKYLSVCWLSFLFDLMLWDNNQLFRHPRFVPETLIPRSCSTFVSIPIPPFFHFMFSLFCFPIPGPSSSSVHLLPSDPNLNVFVFARCICVLFRLSFVNFCTFSIATLWIARNVRTITEMIFTK